MISKEKAEEFRKQIIDHIKKTFPEDKKNLAIHQINSMSDEQLEEFLIQNKLLPSESPSEPSENCVLCGIYSQKIPSKIISREKNAIAVLEINPISKGHILIIPSKHSKITPEIKKDIENLSQKISKKIKSKLSPKKILKIDSEILGHPVRNILPVYSQETITSPRHKASEQELNELEKTLKITPKSKKIQKKPKKEPINEKNFWLPRRIP